MTSAWQFLSDLYPNSRCDEQGFWTTASAANINSDSWLTPLTQYGFIAIDGPDGSKFLQGQTSCDWRQVSGQQASWGSYCNIKGRVLNSFLGLAPDTDHVLLRMRADTTASFCSTLAKYIVFSKAKMRDASDEFFTIGLSGPAAKASVETWLGCAPNGERQYAVSGNCIAVQLDASGQRFECIVPKDQLESSWELLNKQLPVRDSRQWERLNIDQGIAEVCASTQDMFIPQMLNMQLIGAVSFKKGCYTGQEVIARMEYRGKLKRRMYRAQTLEATSMPLPGTGIYLPEQAQSIGNLVSCAVDGERTTALIVVTKDAASAEALHIDSNTGPQLKLLDLPYLVAEKD